MPTIFRLTAAAFLLSGCSGSVVDSHSVPAIANVSPPFLLVGSGAQEITITGSRFAAGAQARWNGATRPTIFVNTSTLTVQLPASDVAVVDTVAIHVVNPGGATSETWAFLVQYPAPLVTDVSPAAIPAGSTGVVLTVVGSKFVPVSTVTWNTMPLATVYVNDTLLSARVPDTTTASGEFAVIAVSSPQPGGGISHLVNVTVNNPVPGVSGVSPDSSAVSDSAVTIDVRGTGFVPTSHIGFSGSAIPTTFNGDSSLRGVVPAAQLADGRFTTVTVQNDQPGGGVSNVDTFAVLNPRPTITGLAPDSVEAGTNGLTLGVSGTGFAASARLRWNGLDRPTTVTSRTELTASLPVTDLEGPGQDTVTVFNPTPGGGESAPTSFLVTPGIITSLVTLDLKANDLQYDASRGLLYAAVAETDTGYGNSIAVIDPETGSVLTSIPLGSNPGPLALSDDASFLYVAVNEVSAVRRMDLATQTATLEIPLGFDALMGARGAGDIVVLPGTPHTIAVSRIFINSGNNAGVAVFDDDIQRPVTTSSSWYYKRIEPSLTPTRLYGYDNFTTSFAFTWLAVDSAGVTQDTVLGNVFGGGFSVDFTSYGPVVYASNGAVVDPNDGTRIGTCAAAYFSTVAPDSVTHRAFFVNKYEPKLAACDLTTFAIVGSAPVPSTSTGAGPRALHRWGLDGLAYTTGTQIIILRTRLASP